MGSKKKPFYRIVAVDSASRRDGRVLDYVGYYNPMTEPAEIKIDQDKVNSWIEQWRAAHGYGSLLAKESLD